MDLIFCEDMNEACREPRELATCQRCVLAVDSSPVSEATQQCGWRRGVVVSGVRQ